MKNTTNIINKIFHWEHFWLVIIVLCVLGLHFYSALELKTTVFDEDYYVVDARSILNGHGTMYSEHPPLSKLFIVEGMRFFGDNPFGWRIFALLFGTSSVILLYFICRRLKMSHTAVIISTFLFAFENLNFVQSGVAMLDVFCLTFMLAAMLLFLREKLILSGFFVGLSILCKMPGIFVLGIFFLFWLFVDRKNWKLFVIPALTAVITVPLLLPLIEYPLVGQITNPLVRMQEMYFHAAGLTFSGGLTGIASRPWEWLSNFGVIYYSYNPQFIGMLSFTVSALIIPSVLYLGWRSWKGDRAALFGLLWFGCTFLPWIAINLIFNRLTYIFYFYLVTGAICIGLGLGIERALNLLKTHWNWEARIGIWAVRGYLILHLVAFFLLSPLVPPLTQWLWL